MAGVTWADQFAGNMMRSMTVLALVAALTSVAGAEEACVMERAIYGDGELG